MIFSKYIAWKLTEPDDNSNISELIKNPAADEIRSIISECRTMLLQGKLYEAKKIYNSVKYKFENSDIDEFSKATLYNEIRQLYSDIELAEIKVQ